MLDGHAALNFSHHVCGWHGSQGSVPFGCPLGGVSASKTLTRTPASLILFDGRPVAHQCWTRLDTKFKRRETELAVQREELEKERGRFEQAVAAREWALQREDQRLTQ